MEIASETRQLLTEIGETARKNLVDCIAGSTPLIPVALPIKEGIPETVLPVPFTSAEDKRRMITILGHVCAQAGCDAVILITDAAMRAFTNEKDARYAEENWDTENPLSYPQGLRQECLIVQYLSFKDRTSKVFIHKYQVKDGVPEFSGIDELDGAEGDIQSCFMRGYEHAQSR